MHSLSSLLSTLAEHGLWRRSLQAMPEEVAENDARPLISS